MDVFLTFIQNWYAWIIASPIAGYIIKFVWKHRKSIGEYIMAWFRLPWTVEKIESKIIEKPPSPDARFCPNCNCRMKIPVGTANAFMRERAWYTCEGCGLVLNYPLNQKHN